MVIFPLIINTVPSFVHSEDSLTTLFNVKAKLALVQRRHQTHHKQVRSIYGKSIFTSLPGKG